MRWSDATIHFALQLMVSSKSSCIERINDLNIIKLPSKSTMRLKRFNYRFGAGMSQGLLDQISESLKNHRVKHKNVGDPYLYVKIDELYVKGSIVYNPANMNIIGLCHDIDSADFLAPTYDMMQQIMSDSNEDNSSDEVIFGKYFTKMILQTIVADLASSWSTPGPFWPVHKTSDCKHLYYFVIDDLIAPLEIEKQLSIRLLTSDMSNSNLSFVLELFGANDSNQLIGKPLKIVLPFHGEDESLLFMFDPVHVLKNIRNYFSESTLSNFNCDDNCFKLQDGNNAISWDWLIEILDSSVGGLYAVGRTISSRALYLNSWSKQRVNLALDIFNEKVESILKSEFENKKQNKDPTYASVQSTYFFIHYVRKFLVGTFCNPIAEPGNSRVAKVDHGIFQQLEQSYKYFEKLRKNNSKACLPLKTSASISSIYFGFCEVWKQFYNQFKDENEIGCLKTGVYLCPARMTQNEIEKLFSKLRGMGCDGTDTFATGIANIKMTQDLQNCAHQTPRKNNSIADHRQFQMRSATKKANSVGC